MRFSGRCRQATKPAATNDQPMATCTGAGRVSASGSRIAIPIANSAESGSQRRQSEPRHVPIVARRDLDENPEIRRSRVFIDAHPRRRAYVRWRPRTKEATMKKPLLITILDPRRGRARRGRAPGRARRVRRLRSTTRPSPRAGARRRRSSTPRVVLDHREARVRFTCNERAARRHAVPPAAARPASRRRLGARQRRAAAALLRAARRRRSSRTESRSSPTTSAASASRRATAAPTSTATSTSSPPTRSARSLPFDRIPKSTRTGRLCTARARPVGWCRWRTHD